MSTQSLANQFGWTITTIDDLNVLVGDLNYVSRNYCNMVSELSSRNYVEEALEPLRLMSKEFNAETELLINHIKTEHISYLEKQKEAIRAQMKEFS